MRCLARVRLKGWWLKLVSSVLAKIRPFIRTRNHTSCNQKYNCIDHHSTCSLFQQDGQSKTRCANTVDEDSPMYRIYLEEVCGECTQVCKTKDQKKGKLLESVKPDEIPGQDPANGRCYGTAYCMFIIVLSFHRLHVSYYF